MFCQRHSAGLTADLHAAMRVPVIAMEMLAMIIIMMVIVIIMVLVLLAWLPLQ
jgi:hypothetical protein